MIHMYDLTLLKGEYIGKEFGWLTVIDVIRNSDRPIEFLCRCRCGNEIKRRWDKVKSGHTSSCGCYRKSLEMSERKSQWFKDNQDKVKERSEKYSQWCKDNPDKVKEKSEKHCKYNKEHLDVLVNQGKRHSQWYKDNPDKAAEQGKRHSQWFKDNPDKVALRSAKHSQWFKDNHDTWIASYNKRLNTYANNPEIAKRASEKYLEWCKNNPYKVKEISKIGNSVYIANCTFRRQSMDLSRLDDIVHSDFIDKLHTGDIKFNDLIIVKCHMCGEYSPVKLGRIFNFSANDLVNSGIHLCKRCSNATSSYEQEIADYISTFYNGECIRNSRKIISPLELDLYYPEKKIAVEFNGNYWHSNKYKLSDYHYNKFCRCLERGIILVSIFERYWLDHCDIIKYYIFDLFNNSVNSLSFKNSGYIDNNYPIPNMCMSMTSYKENAYVYNEHIVYTCGYSKIK